MKIILKKDIQGLGYKDDVVTVKDGYGRNYLVPYGYAELATPGALKQLAESLKQRAHKIAKIKADAEDAAKKYIDVTLVISAKTSDGKHIYGSVGPAQIAEALAAKGIEVAPKLVLLKPVKETGKYTTTVQLHKEVAVEVPFEVISENDAPAEEAAEPETPAEAEVPAEPTDIPADDEEDFEIPQPDDETDEA